MSERRRRVTLAQLEILWENLRLNRSLATGRNKSAQAREFSRRMWTSLAQRLNSQGEGALKDWKGWSKYWNDYKAKLKAKKASIDASQRRTGGGPAEVPSLTGIEQNFISLLGEGFGSGIPGARVEPFDIPPQDLAAAGPSSSTITLPPSIFSSPSSISRPPTQPLPQHSPSALSIDLSSLPPPSSPHIQILALSPLTPQPPPAQQQSPRRRRATSPQVARRTIRRRRNAAAITAEAARRALISVAEERVDVLRELVQEVREIKELLRAFVTPRGE